MQVTLLIPEYFVWHYTASLRLSLNIVTNFVWFTYHFFSIPVLVKTLFAPWNKKLGEGRGGFYLSQISSGMTLKGISWFGGFVARIAVLSFGLLFCAFVALIGLVFFVVWFFLPVITLVLLIKGLVLIFL